MTVQVTSTSTRKQKIHYNPHKMPHNESVCIISTIPLIPVLILIHNWDLLWGGGGVEEPEHEAAHSRLRMHGAIPPLPHISS